MAARLQFTLENMQGHSQDHKKRRFLSSSRMSLVALILATQWLHARSDSKTSYFDLAALTNEIPNHQTEARYNYNCNGNCPTTQRKDQYSAMKMVVAATTLNSLSARPPKEEEFRGSCRLLAASKAVVKKVYGNRQYGGGYCGVGVGKIINGAGFNVAQWGRHAINYENYILKERGWKKLPISVDYPPGKLDWEKVKAAQQKAIKKAPPGSVLVFSGGCTPDYVDPQTKERRSYFKPYKTWCRSDGDKLGHVTVKGDDGFFYTDGRTQEPSVPNRFLVGVWVPPGTDEESCHSPYM